MGSGRTLDGISNFQQVQQELRRSIKALKPNQSFTVIAFCDRPVFEQDLIDQKAEATAKKRLSSWVDNLLSGGGTDPRDAVRIALNASPDIVYLLSDGEFPVEYVDEIRGMNQRKSVIHTVSIGMDAQTLRQIASDSGGKHTTVR
jgi:uncharacterized protein with von Willebrand factor type A (vWA) domain